MEGYFMKKKLGILLAVVMMFSLVACGGQNDAPAENKTAETQTEGNAEPKEAVSAEDFVAEQPILLTSVGQSADVEMVKAMLGNIGADVNTNNLATSADIGDAKTLILAIGGSSKGLGAAGIDADAEIERVTELLSAAEEGGLKIVAIHIGGEARRGDLSDKFIKPSFEKADYAIVVADGDKDGMMEGLANDAGIPFVKIDAMTDTTAELEKIIKK
jgi:predicted small lipoprotein YifL